MNKKLTWTTIQIPLGDLQEWDKNPVSISERDARELAKSIDRFEHVLPYVAAAPMNGKKEIPLLDGHQRKMVELTLRKADPQTLVDVRVPSRKLSDKEQEELVIRLRKNTGEFDFDKLANFFDVPDLLEWGFTEKELQLGGFEFENTSQDAEIDLDRAGELLKKWKVKTGDLWQIGDHRLICGDCTDAATVARVMGNDKAGMMVTDPPYGVEYDPEWRNEAAEKGLISFAARREGKVQNDDVSDWYEAWKLFDGDVSYCWHANLRASTVEQSFTNSGFEPRSHIVWNKQSFAISRGHYHWKHELCIYTVRKGQSAKWIGGRSQSTVWDILWDKNVEGGHSTQKPLECMARPIRNHDFEIIYDPFGGSGTTMVACNNLGRKCRMIEIDPKYCAVILERMSIAFPALQIRKMK